MAYAPAWSARARRNPGQGGMAPARWIPQLAAGLHAAVRHAASLLPFALPYMLLFPLLARADFLTNATAAVLAKGMIAVAAGRPEAVGFTYPPLDVLLAALAPDPGRLEILGLVVGTLAARRIWSDLRARDLPVAVAVPVLAAVAYNPVWVFLLVSLPGTALGLLGLHGAHRAYREWLETGGLCPLMRMAAAFACASLGTSVAPLLALLYTAAVAVPALALRAPARAGALAFVVFFPTAAVIGSWAYLAWLFAGGPVWAYGSGLEEPAPPGPETVAVPLYLAICVAAFANRRAEAPGLLAFALAALLPAATPVAGPIERFALLGIAAAAGLAAGTAPGRLLVVAAALLHLVGAFLLRQPEYQRWLVAVRNGEAIGSQSIEQRLAQRFSDLPAASVLLDDRHAYRIIALAGSAGPFLVSSDSRFEAAISAPRLYVRHVLLRSDRAADSPLALYQNRAPPGFRLESSQGGYRLYTRIDVASPPQRSRPPGR